METDTFMPASEIVTLHEASKSATRRYLTLHMITFLVSLPRSKLHINEEVAALHHHRHGFYSRWGQLGHLTKFRFLIRERDRQTSDIDKQKDHHQETV